MNVSPGLASLDQLATLNKIYVKQEENCIELISPFDCENKYHTYAKDANYHLSIHETSSIICRWFLRASHREMELRVKQKDYAGEDFIMHLHRPCMITICCMNRPEIRVKTHNNELGKIVMKFTCGTPKYVAYDGVGGERFTVEAECG